MTVVGDLRIEWELACEGSRCPAPSADGYCWQAWKNPVRMSYIVQHGDNPEARMEIDDFDLRRYPDQPKLTAINEWVKSVHSYLSGSPEGWDGAYIRRTKEPV